MNLTTLLTAISIKRFFQRFVLTELENTHTHLHTRDGIHAAVDEYDDSAIIEREISIHSRHICPSGSCCSIETSYNQMTIR